MALVVKKTEYEKLDEGLHNGTITKVEDLGTQDTQNGPQPRGRIVFTAADQKDKEGKAVEARIDFNLKLSEKSRLGVILKELGFTPGDQFDLNDLVGLKTQAVVEHVSKDGVVYANITKFIKVRKSQEV